MAKTQNLSLNPTKISGTCGRLMCCLKYEQDAYEDLIRNSPKEESFVDTPEGRGTVVELDLLRQRVKVKMENNPDTIGVFANSEIAILRNGKAKKNDPPIPDDLAPISGSGKRKPRPKEEDRLFLDPIRFRYSTEAIVEEPVEEAPVEEEVREEKQEAKRSNRNRRNRRAKIRAAAEHTEKPQKQEKPEKPQPAEPKPAEAEKAKKNRRPYYRRRRPAKSANKE